MMVSPVSSVSFRNNIDLAREGVHSRPRTENTVQFAEPKEAKKGSFAKKLLALAVIATALIVAPKIASEKIQVLSADELAKAGIIKKAAHYWASGSQVVRNFISGILPKRAAETNV